MAIELVEAGYTVWVPWLADDDLDDYWPRLPWEPLERAGAMLRAKSVGAGANFLLENQTAAGVDFLASLPRVDLSKLSVIGWSEGAQLGAVAAAMDSRISAVVRLEAPLDRGALRRSVAGVLGGALFSHADCALGDPELAALIAPRPLLYAFSTKDQSVSRFAAYASPRVVSIIRDLYVGLNLPTQFSVQSDSDWTAADMRRVRVWLDRAIAFRPPETPAPAVAPRRPTNETYHSAFIDSTLVQRMQYIASLGPCVAPTVRPRFESVAAFESSVEPLRRELETNLRVTDFKGTAKTQVTRRDTVLKLAKYTLEFVEVRSERTRLPVMGLLATPIASVAQSLPVVIGTNGNDGLAAPFGLGGAERVPYLNAYADYLASRGTIVFVPFLPHAFPEVAAAELAARDRDGPTSFGLVVSLYMAAVDFSLTLPQVDSSRIAISGISYAGYAALFTAALDRRISTVVFSNPVTTASVLFSDKDGSGLAAWFGEICSMIDPALTYLIAPRRMIRENGSRDDNGYERYSLESVDQVRQVYRKLGIESQFEFYRHSGGHELLPRLIF
jgi:dienelactone hydrolase